MKLEAGSSCSISTRAFVQKWPKPYHFRFRFTSRTNAAAIPGNFDSIEIWQHAGEMADETGHTRYA